MHLNLFFCVLFVQVWGPEKWSDKSVTEDFLSFEDSHTVRGDTLFVCLLI